MKTLILLSSLLVFSQCGAKNSSGSNRMYEKVLDFIRNSEEARNYLKENNIKELDCIQVSDQVVFMEISSFFEFYNKQLVNKSEMEVLDTLETIDKSRYFKKYKDNALKKLSDCEEGKAILFFSEPFEGKLLAELFALKEDQNTTDYDKLATFNESLMYLFTFDESDSIKNIATTNVIYN